MDIRKITFFNEIVLQNKFIKEKLNNSEALYFGNPHRKEKNEEKSVTYLDIPPKKASVAELKDSYIVYETGDFKSCERRKGDAVHRSLSFLGAYGNSEEFKEDLKRRLDLLVLSEEEKKSMFSFLSGKKMSKYFVGALTFFNEREILSDKGEIFKPDRIVIGDDFTAILDYKTGREREKEYSEQLKKYKSQVRKLFGKNEIELIVVYLNESKVFYVED
ncbi:hypothetical protein JW890_00885 [candidate division WOR-3 bacterium]|nr:hypothetical protein [candidate division WOR-3 bacterium]